MSVQRLPIVVQTSITFGQRFADVVHVTTSRVHWVLSIHANRIWMFQANIRTKYDVVCILALILKNGGPKIFITVTDLKFHSLFLSAVMRLKDADGMLNNVYPDQTAPV